MSDVLATLRARYLAAQLDGDRAGAIAVILDEGLARGVDAQSLVLQVIQPAQHEIGRLWQENAITVAQEHLATAITQVALARLYGQLPRRTPNGRNVIVACPEGERHDLGARVTADFLEMAGFEVRYLGADVPNDDLVKIVAERKPDLLALSVTMAENLPAAQDAVDRVCRATSGSVRIAIGGYALEATGDALPPGVTFTCADAAALVGRASDVLGVPR